MDKILKFIYISIVVGFVIWVIMIMSFQGSFDKKYTREELTQNFTDHQQAFLDAVSYFKNNVPKKIDYSVSFWQEGKDDVSINLYPKVIGPNNKIIEASDVAVDSPKLDSALKILGWSRLTVTTLRDKLEKTNCNYIGNAGHNDSLVSLSPHQTGWGSFTYTFWGKAIVDSLIPVYGRPLGNDSFAIKVTLNYTSAL